jgi:uncharacterized protein YndB with AHSA1/START domain
VQAQLTVQIAAPPERVWGILADVDRWPSWTASVTSVTRLDAGPFGVGSRVRVKQPRLPVTIWTVSQFVPGEAFTWTAKAPGARTDARHEVHAAGPGSVVTLVLDQSGLVGQLFGRLTSGLTKRYMTMEANGLKDRAELSDD